MRINGLSQEGERVLRRTVKKGDKRLLQWLFRCRSARFSS